MKLSEFKRMLKQVSNEEITLEVNGIKIDKIMARKLLYGYISKTEGNKHIKINYKNFFDNLKYFK